MTAKEIDFSPLKNFSLFFTAYRWVKRGAMILIRIIVLGFLFFATYYLLTHDEGHISYAGGGFAINLGNLLFLYIAAHIVLSMQMSSAWRRFSRANQGFQMVWTKGDWNDPKNPMTRMTVPSFKGKELHFQLSPLYTITGQLNDVTFGFFTRMYKEGGVIRWRERQMDTIIWLDLPKYLPNIVIDATANERARRSNKSKHFDDAWKFQFEGTHGAHYNVYADPKDRITAMQLFTPDVLDVIYTSMPDLDIEISGRTIWFVKRYGILNDKLAAEMFAAVEKLISELYRQINTAQLVQ